MLTVVLVEPRIAANTGNIGRLCLAVGARLVIAGPAGFSLSEKAVRRAGLDYWRHVDVSCAASLDEALAGVAPDRVFLIEDTGAIDHWDADFPADAVLVFGNETEGLGPGHLAGREDRVVRIPMADPRVRSLNLSNAVAIVVYEALRRNRDGR